MAIHRYVSVYRVGLTVSMATGYYGLLVSKLLPAIFGAFAFLLLNTSSASAANLLQNADFETGVVEPWSSSGGGATATPSAALKHSGNYSLKVEHSKTGSYGFQQVIQDIEGGMFYEASAYGASDNTNTAAYFLRIAWYESTDGSGSQMEAPTDSDKSEAITGEWTLFKMVIQVPVAAKSAKLRLVLNSKAAGTQASAHFDDLVFQESTSTPNPSPTPSPTPTPAPTTPSPSPTPLPTPSPKPTGVSASLAYSTKKSNTNLVLGIEESPVVEGTESGASTTEEGPDQGRKPFLAIGLVVAGIVLLGVSGYAFLRERSSGRIKDLDEKTS